MTNQQNSKTYATLPVILALSVCHESVCVSLPLLSHYILHSALEIKIWFYLWYLIYASQPISETGRHNTTFHVLQMKKLRELIFFSWTHPIKMENVH